MRVLTQRSDFFLKHAPLILAALVSNCEGDPSFLATLACDLTEALNQEIDKRWNKEIKDA